MFYLQKEHLDATYDLMIVAIMSNNCIQNKLFQECGAVAASLSLSSLFPHSGSKSSSESSDTTCTRPGLTSSCQNLSPPPSPAPSTSLTPSPPSTPAGGHVNNSSSDTIMSSHKNNLPTILEDEIGKSNKENAANEQCQQQNGKQKNFR